MEQSIVRMVLAGAGMASAFAGQDVTPSERTYLLEYLEETRGAVTQAVAGLTEAQWRFRPGPDRWSIAEIVEHLAIVESMVVEGVAPQLAAAPVVRAGGDPREKDKAILKQVPDRSAKYQAPEAVAPHGRESPEEWLTRFEERRKATSAWVKGTNLLRGHLAPHPALGPLDGYQWALTIAAHSSRHTQQILEVKADPGYPGRR